jgi:hypothetical protein
VWGKTKITDQGMSQFRTLAPQVKQAVLNETVDVSKPVPD